MQSAKTKKTANLRISNAQQLARSVADDAPDLICSDAPVGMIPLAKDVPLLWLDPNAMVVMPLSRRVAAIGSLKDMKHPQVLGTKQVARINATIIGGASEAYCSEPAFTVAEGDGVQRVELPSRSKTEQNLQLIRKMHPNDLYKAACEKLLAESSLKDMDIEFQQFDEAVCMIEFDPRFNSVNWMFDCFQLAKEIVYSYCWMSAYAEEVSEHTGHKEFHIQYYADNCITRINSFRDKAALLAWAYYCPFNPNRKEEVFGFSDVLKRLRFPVRFGLAIAHQEEFVAELDKLQGRHFEKVSHYRHLKIHRIEPKILMRPPQSPDGLSYMVPLFSRKEISEFREKLKDVYPDDDMREEIEKGCYIDGVLYDRIRVKDEYWHYAEVEEAARDCTHTCIDVARGLSTILRGRAPLKES